MNLYLSSSISKVSYVQAMFKSQTNKWLLHTLLLISNNPGLGYHILHSARLKTCTILVEFASSLHMGFCCCHVQWSYYSSNDRSGPVWKNNQVPTVFNLKTPLEINTVAIVHYCYGLLCIDIQMASLTAQQTDKLNTPYVSLGERFVTLVWHNR